MADYRLAAGGVVRAADGAFIPEDEGNHDWLRFMAWVSDGNEPDVATLTERKAALVASISAAFDERIAAGFPYGGKVIGLDDANRANITGAAASALASVIGAPGMDWPEGFHWRTQDNTPLPLTAEQMLAMAKEIMGRFTALIYARGALKDAVAAATTDAELDAIDITSGWD